MASRDDYSVGWVCTLPQELKAAKCMLDCIHADLPSESSTNDINNYVLGSLRGHQVVIAYPHFGESVTMSATEVIEQMQKRFGSIRFILIVGIGGGVPNTKEDIRLGDVVVSKPTSKPGLIQFDSGWEECSGDHVTSTSNLRESSNILLTAAGKVETNDIVGESKIPQYISDIVRSEPLIFSRPKPEQDIRSNSDHGHIITKPSKADCKIDSNSYSHKHPRTTQRPKVHYGLVASSTQVMGDEATRDKLACKYGILCFETEAAGLLDVTRCLIIRGIYHYADSHKTNFWQGYAAAVAAAYAKEILLLIPVIPKPVSIAADTYALAATILDSLLLTRPEVDRSSLIALKGRRVSGTCEWLIQHPSFQEWLEDAEPPVLWISGGPGKGKTMLAIYITDELQPIVDSTQDVLLYYFCSNRDRNRNTAVTIMRGIIHQWITFHPQSAQHIKPHFEGSETTKYTISSFASLWRLFLILLDQSASSQVVCVLDGLDECEKESLEQLLDALRGYFAGFDRKTKPKLKLILLSRPQPMLLENKLGQYLRIKLDDADMEIGKDVEKYISAKVAELASQQTLSENMVLQVQNALMAGAEGTFLWVGFVADELKGRSWPKIQEILHGVPKGLGGIYRRLLQQIDDKYKLVPILQWIILAARPLTVNELAVAAEIKASDNLPPTEVVRKRLAACGLLVKINGEVVNLVHESAKEFFQSEQVNVAGISMFHMNYTTHQTLMRTCLRLIEKSYKSNGSIKDASRNNTLLAYAGIYWPVHFRHAFDMIGTQFELSRQFFQSDSPLREDWWDYYWDHEQYGGAPPSFTLLHLAGYFGNLPWAKILLKQSSSDYISLRRDTSRKDNYGRTPLFWAATRGHRDVVELLLDHGAEVNSKDRSKLTPLHTAVTGEHAEVVSLLLNRSARIEGKASYGDTPLIRAIQANSKEIIKLLLEHGARVDGLPTPPGGDSIKGPKESLEERARQLLGLQEQLFAARYENSSRLVGITIRTFTFSFRFPPILQLVTLYLKYSSIGRWEVMHVLQDLVKKNKTAKLRKWAQAYIEFGTQLIVARNEKNLAVMTGLSVLIFQVVSTADLEALLVIGVLVGSSVILAAAERDWREGVDIAARTFAQFAVLAYHREAGEYLHYGVREFLIDFDGCIRSGRRAENVARTTVLFSTHYAILDTKDSRSIEYFSTVIAEYYERFIGGSFEEQLFSDANQACANELGAINDHPRLLLFLTAILQFAQRSREKGQDRFLNMIPAACLILCQDAPSRHRWLIAEAIPEVMSGLISQEQKGLEQKRVYKSLIECLIIGKQYGTSLPVALRETVKQNLEAIEGIDGMLDQILST